VAREDFVRVAASCFFNRSSHEAHKMNALWEGSVCLFVCHFLCFISKTTDGISMEFSAGISALKVG
jgi:hypothetical protein